MLDAASEGEERYPIAGNSSSKEIFFLSLSLFLERGSILFVATFLFSSSFARKKRY